MARFEITLKPTAMTKKQCRMNAEYVTEVSAYDKTAAAATACQQALAEGFYGYAITGIKEITE